MKALFFYTLLFSCSQGFTQDYNYTHYDNREGLAGSTVYHMCQDKTGYMWFATENGVSRFDGKTFKNFTTKDGLTDNEVLYISSDSKGRVWMMPFNKTICYYYNGKIHSPANDSTLRVNLSSYAIAGGENSKGEQYIQTDEGVFVYTNENKLKYILDYKQLAKKYSLDPSEFCLSNESTRYPYSLVVYNKGNVFYHSGDSFALLKKVKYNGESYNSVYRRRDNLELIFRKNLPPEKYTSQSFVNNDLVLYNTLSGSWIVDSNGTVDKKPFLGGKKISHAIKDSEGNLWFSTLGEGIYRLTATSVKTILPSNEFLSIQRENNKIFAGMTSGKLQIIDGADIKEKSFFKDALEAIIPRLYTMKRDYSGNIYLGFDSYLIKYSEKGQLFSPLSPIKSIDIIDNNYIVVCTNTNTLKLRSSDLAITDTIGNERGTKVIYENGYYYIGTLNGLIIIDSKKVVRTIKNDSSLSRRIVDMCKAADGSLWIATGDNGIVHYKNGKTNLLINTHNGLNSNNCKSMFLRGKHLWIGSDKGINKIDIDDQKVIKSYTTANGLSSEAINAIYAENDTLWACTPIGLDYFDEKLIPDSSICSMDMHVSVSGKPVEYSSKLYLPYRDNNISFDYTAISFKSSGEIIYRYRLLGLDTTWRITDLRNISYPSLPSGDYVFLVHAINKLGKESNTVRIEFSIATPYWKTVWFWVSIVILLFLFLWFLLNRRYKTLQRKEIEKNKLAARISELEQLSLRAQINPHFIFNCLTSIQSFILNNDMESANLYIGQFGSIMRQTLDNSSQPYISINREISYLESYLKLEQMRFPSKFSFQINIDKAIHADHLLIPSLFLQPFAENSIRHGIRHKKGGGGFIKIDIIQQNGYIIFTVEDNGIGRQAASQYKSIRHIEYQSKGIKLTLDRLNILSAENNKKIETKIVDLTDNQDQPTGTKVIISFPLSIIEKLS